MKLKIPLTVVGILLLILIITNPNSENLEQRVVVEKNAAECDCAKTTNLFIYSQYSCKYYVVVNGRINSANRRTSRYFGILGNYFPL